MRLWRRRGLNDGTVVRSVYICWLANPFIRESIAVFMPTNVVSRLILADRRRRDVT